MTDARLIAVEIDATGLPAPSPELEQERRVAIFDLLEKNRFAPRGAAPPGPYRLTLGLRGAELVLDLATEAGAPAGTIALPLAPLAQAVRDYDHIRRSYVEAVKRLPPASIEAADAARRGIHDEAARLLLSRIETHADTDLLTARRLFTLVCVLHPEG